MQETTLTRFIKPREHDTAVRFPGGVSAVVTRCGDRTRLELKMAGPLATLWQQTIASESPAKRA